MVAWWFGGLILPSVLTNEIRKEEGFSGAAMNAPSWRPQIYHSRCHINTKIKSEKQINVVSYQVVEEKAEKNHETFSFFGKINALQ